MDAEAHRRCLRGVLEAGGAGAIGSVDALQGQIATSLAGILAIAFDFPALAFITMKMLSKDSMLAPRIGGVTKQWICSDFALSSCPIRDDHHLHFSSFLPSEMS